MNTQFQQYRDMYGNARTTDDSVRGQNGAIAGPSGGRAQVMQFSGGDHPFAHRIQASATSSGTYDFQQTYAAMSSNKQHSTTSRKQPRESRAFTWDFDSDEEDDKKRVHGPSTSRMQSAPYARNYDKTKSKRHLQSHRSIRDVGSERSVRGTSKESFFPPGAGVPGQRRNIGTKPHIGLQGFSRRLRRTGSTNNVTIATTNGSRIKRGLVAANDVSDICNSLDDASLTDGGAQMNALTRSMASSATTLSATKTPEDDALKEIWPLDFPASEIYDGIVWTRIVETDLKKRGGYPHTAYIDRRGSLVPLVVTSDEHVFRTAFPSAAGIPIDGAFFAQYQKWSHWLHQPQVLNYLRPRTIDGMDCEFRKLLEDWLVEMGLWKDEGSAEEFHCNLRADCMFTKL